ncbi:hypothetical protein ACLMJK_001165 [Lecanora helva]
MATTSRAKHSKLDHVSINQGLTTVYPDPDQSKKPSGDDIAVDIVAVPGLGASPDFTWRTNKVDWLRDANMLPRYIENARIMVFEYESQWFGRGSINQRLSTVADQLVQALFNQRPAILSAQLKQNDYPNIFMSVVGSVFLGTPFRGTKSQSKASLLADMAKSVGLGVNSGLLRLLEEGSETLKDLLSDFSSLAREVNMQLFCFFEQHESDIANLAIKSPHLKHKELIVEEDSAHIDGYRTGALASDHFGLNKFTGPKDGRYVSVAGEIKDVVQKAGGILKSRRNAIRQSLVDDATYQTILEDLKATDPGKDLQDSVKGRSASQSWALANDNYLRWKQARTSSVLWIHGGAGKGQPVIANSIINELEAQTKGNDGLFLAYFFCDEKDARRRSVRDILKVLIRQMIWKNRDLTEYLLIDSEKGKSSNRKSQNFDTIPLAALWRNLHSMLNDALVDKIYFVVNAFDETDGDSRKEFLELLTPYLEPGSVVEGASDETSVKWIFLSRSGRPDIEKILQKALVIDTEDGQNADLVNDGVKKEISAQVDDLAKTKQYNNALTYLIKRYIFAKADGNYIYAALVIQELRNLESWQANISSIRKLLEDLPYGLTDMFEFVRRRVLKPQNEGIEYTKEILRCLILAMESPTLSELALLADLPLEVRGDREALRVFIRRCGAFITTFEGDQDDVIEWIDVAAKQHLITYAKDDLSLMLNDVQHGIIALRCLEYVRDAFATGVREQDDIETNSTLENPVNETAEQNSDSGSVQDNVDGEVDKGRSTDAAADQSLPPPPEEGNQDQADDIQSDLENADQPAVADDSIPNESGITQDDGSILKYAVNYWIEHAMQAPADVVEEFDLTDDFWTQDSSARAKWWDAYSEGNGYAGITSLTPLHLAALTGYATLLDRLLESGFTDQLHEVDSSNYTPLAWACENGDMYIVDRLCKAGADVNRIGGTEGPSALWAAANGGHMDVLQYLLEQGAEVNAQNDERGTPLYVAASGFYPDIIRELLHHGADVNLKGGWHVRPLNVASYNGYVDIVEILLEHNVDVDPDDEYQYGSALGAAARRGHAEIVSSLLKKAWNVNKRVKTYGSPLVAAAAYGHTEAIKAMFQHEIEGPSQVQALEIASKNGRIEVVKCLLEQTPYLPHQKAFHNAAMYGRDEIVELLATRGTNSEMLDMSVYDASDQERESTVDLLLKLGASPDAEGKEYGTALQAAAYDGSTGIVKSLLSRNADVHKQGGDYGTALQAAALNGHSDIVQLLLDHGAHVNVGELGRYGSALQAACWSGDSDLVELLISHGADVNSKGGIYGSPIMAAVDESMNVTLEILVNHGADVNVKDVRDEEPTLLVQAGYTLGKESLELLLNHGANLEGTDNNGVTVLISVADSGDKESLEMLIEKGANIRAVSDDLGTALSAAASEGDEECCKVLIDHGADPNQESGDWGTALQAAANAADLDCVNLLLEAGAAVNQIGAGYGCALQAAAHAGAVECLQRLLEVGADVNVSAGEFGCPLQASAIGGHLDCLQILLDHGADVNLEGGMYHSPLQAAAARHDNYDCFKTLLDCGGNVHLYGGLYGSVVQAAARGQNADLWDLFLNHNADVHVQGGKYGNALQASALMSDIDFVQKLLDQGVEVNNLNGKYGTALQAAAFVDAVDIAKKLLEHHANPQLEGGLYGNALSAAACSGSDDCLGLLLDQNLPLEMLDEAFIQAVYHRQENAVDLLLKKGANIEAQDEILGSAFDALGKEPPKVVNSDDEADDSEDEEGSDEESGDGEEENIEKDSDGASSPEVTNDQESVADLADEDLSTTESKIQKLLENAKLKIRRNPTLRRPQIIKRKPVSQEQVAAQSSSRISNGNVQSLPSSGAYQSLGDRWRVSQPQYHDHGVTHSQTQQASPARKQYEAYSNRPPIPQSYSPNQQQPDLHVSQSSTRRPNDIYPIQGLPSDTYPEHFGEVQRPPPLPPKINNFDYSNQAHYQEDSPSVTQQPAQPPRPGPNPTNASNYQAYSPNPQSAQYQPQQPYQTQPYLNNGANYPAQSSDYAPYPPAQYPSQSSSAAPPPFPPRPTPSTNQSTDSLDFARLQEKASKFGASVDAGKGVQTLIFGAFKSNNRIFSIQIQPLSKLSGALCDYSELAYQWKAVLIEPNTYITIWSSSSREARVAHYQDYLDQRISNYLSINAIPSPPEPPIPNTLNLPSTKTRNKTHPHHRVRTPILFLLSLIFSAIIPFATASVLPPHDLALSATLPRRITPHNHDISQDDNPLSIALVPRMDVLDPGDILPGRGWAMSFMKFIPIVGALADVTAQIASQELKNLYQGALQDLTSFPPGSTLPKDYAFFTGNLLSFMVKRESGTDPMTADMIRAFLSHVLVRLAMGGYRGIYVAFIRQKGGPNMFSVKMQSNPYWVSKGIGGLPDTVGLAAMGF